MTARIEARFAKARAERTAPPSSTLYVMARRSRPGDLARGPARPAEGRRRTIVEYPSLYLPYNPLYYHFYILYAFLPQNSSRFPA